MTAFDMTLEPNKKKKKKKKKNFILPNKYM